VRLKVYAQKQQNSILVKKMQPLTLLIIIIFKQKALLRLRKRIIDENGKISWLRSFQGSY